MSSLDDDILSVIGSEFRTNPPAKLGVAVSGGGDSVALLHALARYFKGSSTRLFAVTVDHGLRPEAGAEVDFVAEVAASLSLPHERLNWSGWDGKGNLQDRARAARYDLMARWARARDVPLVALGHTEDDQAETVLMRLARGSGVDGLSAIPRRRCHQGVTFLRPFLGLSRDRLRAYLKRHAIDWIEDSSNTDARFTRVRVRSAAAKLAELGLTVSALCDVAEHMRRSREALDWYTFIAAHEAAHLDGGDVLIDLRQFRTLPEEIARRLLVHALRWVGSSAYPPRRNALMGAIDAIRAEKPATLHGCLVLPRKGLIWICREYSAVCNLEVSAGEAWDSRWRVSSHVPPLPGLRMRALGRSGLKQCANWRATKRPLATLLASPSLWNGQTLVCAPLAGLASTLAIELTAGADEFFASLLSH